jgi:ribonuclease P protein component
LILQIRRHDQKQRPPANGPAVRFGLTASKKVGNAVARNRARRRLRDVACQVLAAHALSGHDFVVIARTGTITRDFGDLKADLIAALRRLGAWSAELSPP